MQYPQSYDVACKFTLQVEGGYVYDPTDAGGETNFGITDKSDGKVDRMVDMEHNGLRLIPIKQLTSTDAKEYYFRWYWVGLCENLSEPVAAFLFDCSVNHGYARAKRWLSESSNLEVLLQRREAFYHDCVAHRPANIKYLNGWLNRIDAFCKQFKLPYRTKR